MTTKVERLTISVPRDLIALTDEVANEWKVSRSKVVTICLQQLARERLRDELAEGYKVMAKENLRFAAEAAEIAHEVVPPWE
jgi:metal-responsive CopG/Arc/MetJ family transcriptional regulator